MEKDFAHSTLIAISQEILGIKDTLLNPNEIESAVFSAFQTFGGSELFPSDFDKIIHICYNLSGSHGFKDANKRTTSIFLCAMLNYIGMDITLSDKALADLVIKSVTHEISEEEFSSEISKHTHKQTQIRRMKVYENSFS